VNKFNVVLGLVCAVASIRWWWAVILTTSPTTIRIAAIANPKGYATWMKSLRDNGLAALLSFLWLAYRWWA
jgi:hypothetical protein